MRYRDPSSRVLVRDLTPRRIERIEAQAFERDYARSRHNMSAPGLRGVWCNACRDNGCAECNWGVPF